MNIEEPTEIVEKESSKMNWLIGGLVLLLLVAAGTVAYKMLATPENSVSGVVMGNDGTSSVSMGGATSTMFDMKPAPEIPSRQADETGLYISRTDDLLTIGTGDLTLSINQESAGVPEFSYSGIERDIVVTNQTKLYQDVTDFDINDTAVQQKMQELENLDDLTGTATVQVWGRREGDRVIAEVIVVSLPTLNMIP